MLDQIKAFMGKTLFQIDGLTFTVLGVFILLVLVYFLFLKR